MNYYFLVEGNKTEMLFYPKLINFFQPQYTQIYDINNFGNNNFYMFSGKGNPQIFNKLKNALLDIEEINKITKHTNIKIDILFLVIDSDKYPSFKSAVQSINDRLDGYKELIKSAKVKIIPIVQRECIESWFLGNPEIIPSTYSKDFNVYIQHYNVSIDDPELMPSNSEKTRGQYAYSYLTQLFLENGLVYTKSCIDNISDNKYIANIYQRSLKTGHLQSFLNFVNIINRYK